MQEIFDIRAKIEQQRMEVQKEFELIQKETSKEQIEDLRHKENTRLAKIGIALAAIALIVSLFALFR